ncbi:ribose transport system substrate-binding protein [Butyrivibrio hungatei DSM 14810]|uniref:Sugar ABC transporter substrate-binding protein n=2 Tax=Butyrivibrio hungatei TaxID=185008 RepID=A0A1D9P025_9FIRM|nr:substrate-binding domain-containing protein [Butyrivibrio hungatei]AOZ95986.1 sugar ABC transporter substrate-binding protein [Butyrivibrio hungatei]SHN53587.1 ribose transport system substrate-binding protein [Butyrivibrio hungatei DSM 14810]
MNKESVDKYKKRIVRQYLILIFTLVFVLATLFVGAFTYRFYKIDIENQADATVYDKYYVMITDNYKADFWKSVYEGALATAKKDNIYVDLLGENLSEGRSCEELMKIAIASKVDGIIVYANESAVMTRLINDAVSNGIPVVTLYGDSARSDRLSFVGVGGYSIGKLYGKQILGILEKKSENDEENLETKVCVLASADTQNTGQNIIISSMQDTINEEAGDSQNISVSIVTVDNTNTFSAEESIRDIFLSEEVPDVIVCLNELNTICAYQAVVDFNMVGEVDILGYYDSKEILSAIDKGVVHSTISINTDQLGEYSVSALYDYYEYGNTSQYYMADITLINKDNVADFINKEGKDE